MVLTFFLQLFLSSMTLIENLKKLIFFVTLHPSPHNLIVIVLLLTFSLIYQIQIIIRELFLFFFNRNISTIFICFNIYHSFERFFQLSLTQSIKLPFNFNTKNFGLICIYYIYHSF